MSNHSPTRRHQLNGWTPEHQQRFLAHLALHGSIAAVRRRSADVRLLLLCLKRAERRKIEASHRQIAPESSHVEKLRAELPAPAAGEE